MAMSGSTVTEVNGMVVVTQVFPKAAGREAEKSPPDSPVYAPAKVSAMTAAFLRGQPKALGIVQVFVGLVCMSSGLVGIVMPGQKVQIPLIANVMFVVSGSVAVAAKRGTSISMIRATLGTHVLSVLVSMAGMVFLPWLLATQGYQTQLCQMEYINSSPKCDRMLWDLTYTLSGMWGLVLFLTVSEFCIAVSLCVFSGRALSRSNLYMSHTMVVDAASPTSMSEANLLDGAVMA